MPSLTSAVSPFREKKPKEKRLPTVQEIQPLFDGALHFTTLTEAHDVIVVVRGQDEELMETHVCSRLTTKARTEKLYTFPEWLGGELEAKRVDGVSLRRFSVTMMAGLFELITKLASRGSGRGLYGIGRARTYGTFKYRVRDKNLFITVYTHRADDGLYEFVFLVQEAP